MKITDIIILYIRELRIKSIQFEKCIYIHLYCKLRKINKIDNN